MSGSQPPIAATPPPPTTIYVQAPAIDQGWRLDKSIGLAVVFAVLAQLLVCLWYAESAMSQLSDHEKRITKMEQSGEAQSRTLSDTLSDLKSQEARIEQKVDDLAARRTR